MKLKQMILMFSILIMILVGLGIVFSKTSYVSRQTQKHDDIYYCPMHPNYTSPHPGNCPICNMRLVKRELTDNEESLGKTSQRLHEICLLHNCVKGHDGRPCPMMVVTQDGQKVTCPICGTHLLDEQAELIAVEGYSPIKVSPEKRQLLGMTTVTIQERVLEKVIRVSGKVSNVHNIIEAQVFEIDLPLLLREQVFIRGQEAEVEVPALGNMIFDGFLRSGDRDIDPVTHTVKIRIQIHDPQWELWAGMYVNVNILVDLGKAIAVPQEAVLDTGTRQIVFVDKGKGIIAPRKVVLGVKSENDYQVKSGLKEGDVVVTSANFLLDSESRLKAALSDMNSSGGDHADK